MEQRKAAKAAENWGRIAKQYIVKASAGLEPNAEKNAYHAARIAASNAREALGVTQ